MGDWPESFERTVRTHLTRLQADAPLVGDVPLLDYGLDSLATVNLLVDLEQNFTVEFPDELLTASTFATADSLWSVLVGLCDTGGGGAAQVPVAQHQAESD